MVAVAVVANSIPLAMAGVSGDAVVSDLNITLHPATARLEGSAVIMLPDRFPTTAVFRLSPAARISRVWLNDGPAAHRHDAGRLVVSGLGAGTDSGSQRRITIAYSAVFNDPVPEMPLNTDNPGYGVTGTIGAGGVFLMGGAGWYPALESHANQMIRLNVTAPDGVLAVTAGRRVGHDTNGGQTRSVWEVTQPVGPLSLSAAAYHVAERQVGPVAVYTYFKKGSADLEATYLGASQRFIELYQRRFGPYPFPKFAVVENFFPTGYGFPSYTLLGTRVLRLPFIPYTSLGHEIAHCWWGNGVFVDLASGNWSEGLTTYVADYLFKEMAGAEDARGVRRQWLRNYATLVAPEADFPLSQFRSRTDPVTRVVGYDKSAMVFHMVRKRIGEDHFWQGLRRFFTDKRFQEASWDDIREVFSEVSGQDLDGFFKQWVHRKGAPSFSFDKVTITPADAGFRIDGIVRQSGAPFDVAIPVTVFTEDGQHRKILEVSGVEAPFSLETRQLPVKLALDPDVDVFRRLARTEVPPTVNTLKASKDLLVVVANRWQGAAPGILRPLLVSLGMGPATMVAEARVRYTDLAGRDVLFLGVPSAKRLFDRLPTALALAPNGFAVDGTTFDTDGDALFTAFPHPVTEGKVAALFHPLSGDAAYPAIRKITHYGKYSTLVFTNGNNRVKETWPVTASPMEFFFPVPGDRGKGSS